MNTEKVSNEEKGNEVLADVSRSLTFGSLEIGLKDKDGDFEISIDTNDEGSVGYAYITIDEAKQIIAFLQEQIKS